MKALLAAAVLIIAIGYAAVAAHATNCTTSCGRDGNGFTHCRTNCY